MAQTNRPPILIIGSLPPPAIGPSLATQRLLKSPVINEALNVHFLDISDHRKPTNIGIADFGNILLALRHALAFLWMLITRRPKVIYLPFSQGYWGYLRDLTFIIPAVLSRRSLVLHLRGSEFKEFYRKEMPPWMQAVSRWAFKRTYSVIVLGHCLRPTMSDVAAPEQIDVIPNGIDVADFDRNRSAVNRKSEPADLLFLSSLRERKGLFVFLDAVSLARQQFPGIKATIAGDWQSAAEEQQGKEMIQRLDLARSVTFVGEVHGDRKCELYLSHKVFVFTPTLPEGLPWVLLEAMCAKMPIVTSDQGAIVEVVKQGETGHIVDPKAKSVAAAICDLLGNPDRARAMGEAGRARVEAEFSEQVLAGRIRDAILAASHQRLRR